MYKEIRQLLIKHKAFINHSSGRKFINPQDTFYMLHSSGGKSQILHIKFTTRANTTNVYVLDRSIEGNICSIDGKSYIILLCPSLQKAQELYIKLEPF